MKHLDLLIHLITLLSGLLTAILGFLLFAKYKIKAIWHYSFFILTTNLTVLNTALSGYLTNNTSLGQNIIIQNIGYIFFELFILVINYSFSSFALGIINKRRTLIHKIYLLLPCFLFLISTFLGFYYYFSEQATPLPSLIALIFLIILGFLFLTFIIYSILIIINNKKIKNADLKHALKVLALLFVTYIPLQALVVMFLIKYTMVIFISRNLFYFLINVISFSFAVKYFFLKTPTILDKVKITYNFIKKFSITDREKEIIELQLSGLSIRGISHKLDRSFKTINNHIYNIYQKTGVNNKIELLNLIKDNQV